MMDFNRFAFRHIFYLTLLMRREWFLPTLARLRQSQYLPADELRALQLRELNRLLKHAKQNTLFYRDRLPDSLKSLDDLSTLPVLTKDDLRNRASELMTRHGVSQRLKTSGGSTGAPVTLLKDAAGAAQEMAATQRGYEWAGIRIGDRQARFWGVPHTPKARLRARLIDFVCNRRRVSAFAFNEHTLKEAHARLQRFKPVYFYGYVSVLREFSRIAPSPSHRNALRPKAVITTAEMLTEGDRTLFSETFQAPVFNEYGCGELGTIAHECEAGSLHCSAENIIVEAIRPDGTPANYGESGELVATDLTNYSTPIIRYKLGDNATLGNISCNCGRTLPTLRSLDGRDSDTLVNTSGHKFHRAFFVYLLDEAERHGLPSSGVQFVQDNKLNLTVYLVCDIEVFSMLADQLETQIHQQFDKTITIDITRVNSIPREPSGKIRVVKRLRTDA